MTYDLLPASPFFYARGKMNTKVLLIFPPVWEATQPYLALPTLVSYLKQHGVNQVSQWDLNLEFHDTFISSSYMANLLLSRSPNSEFNVTETMQNLVPRLDWAKGVLRSKAYYEPEYFMQAKSVLEQAYQVLSAFYAPSILTPEQFIMPYNSYNSDQVNQATTDQELNPFIRFYKQQILPEIEQLKPDLIGFSIADAYQVIPTMTLAKMIRQYWPQIHITIGGSLFSKFAEEIAKKPHPALDVFFHSLVKGEGEIPLLKLVEALDGQGELKDVPNLLFQDKHGTIHNNPMGTPASMNETLAPDFDGLPLNRYFVPDLILPVLASRDCYWKDCAFCDHYVTYAPRYRLRKPEKMAEDLALLKQKYHTHLFSFGDETMSPNYARHLSNAIQEKQLTVKWSMLSRLQRGFDMDTCQLIKRAGGDFLIFGMESGSQRVLDLMAKGTRTEEAITVYQNLDQAGIYTHSFIFFGFPGESESDAHQTLRFVANHAEVIHSLGVGYFSLKKFSPMFKKFEQYGIETVSQEDVSQDWIVDLRYSLKEGVSQERAKALYLEGVEQLWHMYGGPLWLVDSKRSTLFLYLNHHGKHWMLNQDFRGKVNIQVPVA